MSTLSDQHRQMATEARSDAASAKLPNVQKRHLRSAERFDHIAQEIESVAKAKARNDAAKEPYAAVVFELLRAVVNGHARPFASKLDCGSFVRILKSSLAANVID